MFYCQLMPLLRKISSFETMFLDSLCVWSFYVFSLLSLKWFFCPLSLTGTDSSSPASWSHFFLPTAASVCWAFTPAASIRTETAAETTQHIYIFYGNEYKKEENSLRMFGEVELSVVLNSVSWDFGNACHTHCLPELHSLVPVAEKSLCSWTRIIRHEKSCSGTWNLRGKTCWH